MLIGAAVSWLGDILDNLGGAFTNLGGSILTFIKTAFSTLFLDTSGSTTTLSTLGIFIICCAGISLTIGITKVVFGLVKHMGK